MRASQLSELSQLGLSPEQQAAVEQLITARCDEAVERYRSVNRERVRRFRAKQTKTSQPVTQVKRNVTTDNGNVTQINGNVTHVTCSVTPAKSLKVSRNFRNVTDCNVSRGETYKEGGRGTLQVSSLSENKPSEFAAVAAVEPEVPKIVPMRQGMEFSAPQQPQSVAQTPKAALFALAKSKLGRNYGSLIGRWRKDFPDDQQLLEFLTKGASKFPDEPQALIGFVVECIKVRKDDAASREKARKAIAEWSPRRGALLPSRDVSDPQQRFYLTIDGKRRYMDTLEVYRKYDDFCYEHGIVEG